MSENCFWSGMLFSLWKILAKIFHKAGNADDQNESKIRMLIASKK